jgi:hypothetical protein
VVITKGRLVLVTDLKINFSCIKLLVKPNSKITLFLCLIKHHAIKKSAGVYLKFRAFLTSTLDEASQLRAPTDLSSQGEPQVHTVLGVRVINVLMYVINVCPRYIRNNDS